MRTWTKSACVVLGWTILVILVAGGMKGSSVRPVQANTRTASSAEITLVGAWSVAGAPATSAKPIMKYVVRHGDTLSGIAARFAVRGGWPALYAANQHIIGPNPNLIHPGTVIVLPGRTVPTRYAVAAGDTLSGIAARFAVRGGWPALYAANRQVIGLDPNTIDPGTVLRIPHEAEPSPPASRPAHRKSPTGVRHLPPPPGTGVSATGMPQWLKALLAVGLFILAAFIAVSVLLLRRRRRRAADRALPLGGSGRGPGPGHLDGETARVVLADHDRLVVTRSMRDDTVYVLRPPGEDPRAILRVARLVLPEHLYEELAERLGVPVSWPIVLADHDRLVVTRSMRDDTVYVLRPPGEDPRAILRVARLVLPEDPYEELAERLGVPASWPME